MSTIAITPKDPEVLAGLYIRLYVAVAKLICPACEHELQHHADKHGCEIERGDGYRRAEFQEALGPCGCNDDDLREDYPDFLGALEAFRKAKGESL